MIIIQIFHILSINKISCRISRRQTQTDADFFIAKRLQSFAGQCLLGVALAKTDRPAERFSRSKMRQHSDAVCVGLRASAVNKKNQTS